MNMVNSRGLWFYASLAGTVAGLTLGGCTQQKADSAPAPAPKAAAAPAPAAAAPAAKPAAAPAAASTSTQFWPTGRRESSAIAVEKIAPAEVSAGQSFDYTLRVTNLTASVLENVVLTDTTDANFKPSAAVPAPQSSGNTHTFGLGKMNPGEVKDIKITGAATGVGSGILTNCASVAYSLPLCVATKVVQPALAITKAITPESILNCDPITTTIKVVNNGSGMAKNVKITDALPAGLTTADGKSNVEIIVGDLAAGQEKSFPIALKAGKTGRFDNVANATADGGLKAESNKVTTVVKQPVLTIACRPGSDKVVLGRDTTFTFTIKNTGDAACDGTTVTAALPAGTTFKSADNGGTAAGQNVSWNLGALPAGQEKNVTVTVSATAIGNVPVSATVACKCAAPATTTCQVAYVGIPAMLLDGFDGPDPVQVGGNTTYTLTVTNQGFADLTNVSLECTLDAANLMQYVSSSGGTLGGTKVTFPAIPVLKVGGKQTFTIVVKAMGEGQVQVKAEAKSNEITRTLIKTETTNFYK
jgi:uncharacterized repeat protein (TIGR01451 family)